MDHVFPDLLEADPADLHPHWAGGLVERSKKLNMKSFRQRGGRHGHHFHPDLRGHGTRSVLRWPGCASKNDATC